MAQTWSEVLDRSSRRSEAGSFEIPLGQGTIRFIRLEKGESEGVRGFDVAAVDKRRILAEARARGLETSENQVMAGGARIRLI
jgi:hypothetical protein